MFVLYNPQDSFERTMTVKDTQVVKNGDSHRLICIWLWKYSGGKYAFLREYWRYLSSKLINWSKKQDTIFIDRSPENGSKPVPEPWMHNMQSNKKVT